MGKSFIFVTFLIKNLAITKIKKYFNFMNEILLKTNFDIIIKYANLLCPNKYYLKNILYDL